MMFDEWWGKNNPLPVDDPAWKARFAECWNAALVAAQVQVDRIQRQASEPQDPAITDLATWASFYQSRFRRAVQLIAAKVGSAKHGNEENR